MYLLYYKDSVQNLQVFNVLCPTYICNNDLLVDFFTLMNGSYSRNKDYSQFKHNFYNIHHRKAFKSLTIAIKSHITAMEANPISPNLVAYHHVLISHSIQ